MARPVGGFEAFHLGQLGQRRTHHVLALREHAAMPFGQGEVRRPAVGRADLACHHVDSHAVAAGQIRIGHPCEQGVDLGRWQADQQQAVVDGIEVEDLAKARRDHGADAELLQAPHRMFTAGPATEVRAGHQHGRARVGLLVQHEAGTRPTMLVKAQVIQQAAVQPRLVDDAQELLGHDLVGIQIGERQRRGDAFDQRIHLACSQSRASTMRPASAAAAAMAGLIRCVRPARPWRPSKFRLVVEAQRSPGRSTSSFMARHIEQPGWRHSKPASINCAASPSASACARTAPEPGTTIARTPAATFRPRTIAATTRRSSMRPLVHEPMNTRAIGTPAIGMPGARPM
ncbi:hypothetical protein G6F57_016212 [Rhizopus arrhizus]|nr:hypothetical protein G6F57_016212 [Rhizopus arrhizus]